MNNSRLFFIFTFILIFTFTFWFSLFHFHYTTRQLNMWLATSALLPAVFHFDFHFHFLTFTFHFHYTARQLNMWLAMSDVLLAVFHFSAPLPYGRTRAPIKKLPQWSICILLWQKGTITCLPVELSLLAYRRLEFQNIVCSILSFSEDMNALSMISVKTFGSVWWSYRFESLNGLIAWITRNLNPNEASLKPASPLSA